jgi:PucR family transcriptional regulator, purine catabolism regulatory protein
MAVTVADVLAMPSLRKAQPVVLAGADALDRAVRWVHTTELPDIGPLLRGGDLVMTTGIALSESEQALGAFADSLWESHAAGLAVELGRRWTEIPSALTDACARVGLPLVALHREVRFAAVAQSVGERIVDDQLAQLREAQHVHEVFTNLSVAEAGPQDILDAVASLAGTAVVLESGQHRVLDYRPGPGTVDAFLDDWELRSRAVQLTSRTHWDESNGWLLTQVGRPERGWGRLVIDSVDGASARLVAVAERGAAALALHRLNDRQRDGQLRRLHHELLVRILTGAAVDEVRRRCVLAGFPVDRRQLVGLALRPDSPGAVEDVVAAALHAASVAKTRALVALVDEEVLVLLSLSTRTNAVRVSDDVAVAVARRHRVVAACGTAMHAFEGAGRTLREAQQVLRAVRVGPGGRVHRLEDVHVRGLLALLRDDERLRAFADRELSRLREADAATGGRLEQALRALLEHPGSKSAAAASLPVSRPVFYERVGAAAAVLGVDLDDPEIRTSLHLALLVDELAATKTSPSPTPG